MPKMPKKSLFKKTGNIVVKKKFKRKKGFVSSGVQGLSVSGRLFQGFPDIYRCWMKVSSSQAISGAVSSTLSWLGNSLYNVGPNINNGGYATNYPAGLKYLFDSTEGTGNTNTAPYRQYRVMKTVLKYQWESNGTANPSVRIVIFPHRKDTVFLGSLSINQVTEQPFAHTASFPPVMNEEPKWHKVRSSPYEMFGYRHKSTLEAGSLDVSGTGGPTYPYYMNMYIFGDGVSNIVGQLTWEVYYHVEFIARNFFASNAP